MFFYVIYNRSFSNHERVLECVQVCVRVFLCTVCESFMCNNLATINHFCFFTVNRVHVHVHFYFHLHFSVFAKFLCLFRQEFHFSVVSVYFGVKSIEPKCPIKHWNKKKQPPNQATPCKYVCRFSLLSICFCFCLFLLLSCVFFAVFRSPTVSRVFFSVVFFFISLWFTISKIVVRPFSFVYGHTNTFLLPCCAPTHPCHTCGKATHTLHYITLHDDPVACICITCAVCDSSCYSFEHTTSMPSSNSMDSKSVHTGFAISIWGVFPLTFPSISFFSRSLHFVNVGTNHTYILSAHNHVWCMYCTLYTHFYRFSFWAGVRGRWAKRRCRQAFINLHRFIND